MSKKLRPCPFCGGQAKLLSLEYGGSKVYGVFCQDDLKQEYQHGHFVDNHSSPQEAIDDWKGGFIHEVLTLGSISLHNTRKRLLLQVPYWATEEKERSVILYFFRIPGGLQSDILPFIEIS